VFSPSSMFYLSESFDFLRISYSMLVFLLFMKLLLNYCRIFKNLAFTMRMITQACYDTKEIFFIVFVLVMGFSFAGYVI